MSYMYLIVFLVFVIGSMVRILSEWERGVVLRFGRLIDVKGPGINFIIPVVDRLIKVDTRTVTMDVQPQDIITRDNVSMKVNAVMYFRIVNPESAITQIEDYYFATSQLAQTTLRSSLGKYEMDDLLSNREAINQSLQESLDEATEPWGIKVTAVEMKQIDLPSEMQRAMARQAEAERERRAKVISAEGELERSEKLAQAARKMANDSSAISLAYLHTLSEISNETSNTVVFPVPLELMKPFFEKAHPSNPS
tara:strand:+ start:12727 stop:13482 length:756 start_codon:yes stop_codon:yes gene_type:complete